MKQGNYLVATPKKRIWIDLVNSPHIPFFMPVIEELNERGYAVTLTARDCYQVLELADLHNLSYKRIGRHYGKNKIFKVAGMLFRAIQSVRFVMSEKPDIALSHGSRVQVLLASIFSIPSVLLADYEFCKFLPIVKPTWLILPEAIPDSAVKKHSMCILKYPGIKEDVYVPSFKPDSRILCDLGVKGDGLLVTIRPPATEAHYHSRKSDELFEAVIDFLGRTPNLHMVLLPRNEKQETLVRKTWPRECNNGKIIVPDRVVDGLNLIWHSDLVISGGGTMNREAAALGVPVYSIFRGKIGAVDQYLANSGRLVLLENVEDIYTKIILKKCRRSRKMEHTNRVALHRIVDEIAGIIER